MKVILQSLQEYTQNIYGIKIAIDWIKAIENEITSTTIEDELNIISNFIVKEQE